MGLVPVAGGGEEGRVEGRRVEEVLARWDARLAEAVAAWERMPAGERRRSEQALDERGETDEWVLALWAWWERAPLEERDCLAGEVTLVAGALRAAARAGALAGPGEEADAARHLLAALTRLDAVLRPPR